MEGVDGVGGEEAEGESSIDTREAMEIAATRRGWVIPIIPPYPIPPSSLVLSFPPLSLENESNSTLPHPLSYKNCTT